MKCCAICGTSYRKIDTLLVCANGHTLQNTTEVAYDDVPMQGRTKKLRAKKKIKKVKYKSDDCKLLKLVLLRLIFEEARAYFDIKSDAVFKYFTEFFEFKGSKLNSYFDAKKFALMALVYISKRSEMEKAGKIYLFIDFMKSLKSFDISGKLWAIKSKYPVLSTAASEFIQVHNVKSTIMSFRSLIYDFTSLYTGDPLNRNLKASETGILEECIESARHNMRRLLPLNLDVMRQYFEVVCGALDVEITPDLELYFEKYVYTYDPGVVLVPEYDFPMLIMGYFISQDAFEDTVLEAAVIEYFGVTREYLITIHYNPFARRLSKFVTPEAYISHLDKRNRDRFASLTASIEFIDAYKRLVGGDMIDLLLFDRKKHVTWDKLTLRQSRRADDSESNC